MRKHSILSVACHGLAIVLSCLPRAWSAPHGTLNTTRLAKRAITDVGCDGVWGTALQTALIESENIVTYALPFLQTLRNNLNMVPVPSIIGMSNAERTVFHTYEAFFGQTYFGTNNQDNRNKNAEAIRRLDKVIKTAQRIQAALSNPASVDLEIHCGDSFMVDWSPDGKKYGNGVEHFDMRKWLSHGTGAWVTGQTCTQSMTTTAYTYDTAAESVIVLCTGSLLSWTAKYAAGDSVSVYHDYLPVQTNVYQMDYLWHYMPATLIHELTHASTVMKKEQNDEILGDQCLRNNLPAYQWQCIRELAKEDADFAAANADTFSLFVTAIYFNKNDWSTGVGQNLGYIPLVPT